MLGTAEGPISTSCSPGLLLWKPPQSFSGSWRAAGTQKPESEPQGLGVGLCSKPQSTHKLEGAAPASLQGTGDQIGHGIALISVSWGPFRSSVTVKINK